MYPFVEEFYEINFIDYEPHKGGKPVQTHTLDEHDQKKLWAA